MNFKNLSILYFILLAFSSCTNEDILTDADMTDAQLIQAIQQASKQVVDAADLPAAAASALSSEFPESYNQKTELAADLGYEVRMVIEGGIRIGDLSDVYFDLDGRQLRMGDDRDDDDRDDDEGGDREECFDLVYPVIFVMPDGTEVTGDTELEVGSAIRDWQVNNNDFEEGPELQYPVDIVFEDGSILSINNDEEMREAYEDCSESEYDCPELRLNIGDECGMDADDNPVYVDENCECIGAVEATYDCPDLEANIGDECRDSDGNIGLIDSDCECDLD